MADITNQQLLKKLEDKFDKKFDLIDRRFDQMDARFDRLEHKFDLLDRKVDEHMSINTKHHLATRAQIGEVNRKFDHLMAGLAQAISPA